MRSLFRLYSGLLSTILVLIGTIWVAFVLAWAYSVPPMILVLLLFLGLACGMSIPTIVLQIDNLSRPNPSVPPPPFPTSNAPAPSAETRTDRWNFVKN